MNQYAEELKYKMAEMYSTGFKVKCLCTDFDIPRSTMYYWLNKFKVIKKTDDLVR